MIKLKMIRIEHRKEEERESGRNREAALRSITRRWPGATVELITYDDSSLRDDDLRKKYGSCWYEFGDIVGTHPP